MHRPDCPCAARKLLCVAIAAAATAFPSVALADGDPASDVLLSQDAFVPSDAGASASQQATLNLVLAAARRRGYPIRVAVITAPSDLGSVTALWRHPQDYARFLQQELSLAFRGVVLIAMPNGFGAAAGTPLNEAEKTAIARARPAAGSALIHSAATAAAQLAAAAGRPLPASALSTPQAAPPAAAGSNDATAWLAFAIGAVLIAVAWGVSLRVRPPGRLQR